MKIILLPKALERLEEIYVFFQSVSEDVAACVYNDILDEIGVLESFPQMAVVESFLSDCGKVFRSLVVMKHYKVIYYIEKEENTVYIATIWDCRQNPEKLKNEIK